MNINKTTKEFFKVRNLRVGEEEFLKDMLYEAIFLPAPQKSQVSKDIILHSDLLVYYEDWGRNGDIALVAEHTIEKKLRGRAWGRLFTYEKKGFGFVSECIPEISVAVIPGFKNRGIGTKLIKGILDDYSNSGFKALSLSVSKKNPSISLYHRLGFKIHYENENDYIMIIDLAGNL